MRICGARAGTLLDWMAIPVRGTRLKVAAEALADPVRAPTTGGRPDIVWSPPSSGRDAVAPGRAPMVSYQCSHRQHRPQERPSYNLCGGAVNARRLWRALRRGCGGGHLPTYTGHAMVTGGPDAPGSSLDGIPPRWGSDPAASTPGRRWVQWAIREVARPPTWSPRRNPYAPDVRLVAIAAGGVPPNACPPGGGAERRGFLRGLALGAAVGTTAEYRRPRWR